MFTRHGAVTVTSTAVSLAGGSFATLEGWVRRGSDSFSENPDNGEDLTLEFLNSSGVWVLLRSFNSSDIIDGGIVTFNESLPVAAFHAGFRIRFSQTAGSGSDFDYWHVDDIELTLFTGAPPAPSGLTANGCDDFSGGLANFSATSPTSAGTSGQTFNSASASLFLRHSAVTVTSVVLDTSSLNEITVWVRRGADTFSENPDANENLIIEYLNSSGVWVALETFPGTGTQGEIFNRTYTATAAMRHSNFQIRFRLTQGSGSDFDYWHVDDLCFSSAPPDINVQKTSVILSDPVNAAVNPKAIPGAIIRYTITVQNTGLGMSDNSTLIITDALPANMELFVGDLGGGGSPFLYTDGSGANSSGLTLNFTSLGSPTDDVIFFDSGSSIITPTPDFDPAVASFFIRMAGAMNGTASGGSPVFTIQYDARVK